MLSFSSNESSERQLYLTLVVGLSDRGEPARAFAVTGDPLGTCWELDGVDWSAKVTVDLLEGACMVTEDLVVVRLELATGGLVGWECEATGGTLGVGMELVVEDLVLGDLV